MVSRRSTGLIVLGLVLVAVGAGGYWLWHGQSTPPLVGIVHSTEVRIAPEIGGRLVRIQVHKGDFVHTGDVVAELSALELNRIRGASTSGARQGNSRPQQCLCRYARRAARFNVL